MSKVGSTTQAVFQAWTFFKDWLTNVFQKVNIGLPNLWLKPFQPALWFVTSNSCRQLLPSFFRWVETCVGRQGNGRDVFGFLGFPCNTAWHVTGFKVWWHGGGWKVEVLAASGTFWGRHLDRCVTRWSPVVPAHAFGAEVKLEKNKIK